MPLESGTFYANYFKPALRAVGLPVSSKAIPGVRWHDLRHTFAVLCWLRCLLDRHVGWERADQADVRAFVEHLREAPAPRRRRTDAPAPRSINPRTGKPVAGRHYAARTINHQLSVLFGFYEHACVADLGPLINPVPAQRGRSGGRVFAHHNPMEDFVLHRRATYRQKTTRPSWRASMTTRPSSCSPRCGVSATGRSCRSRRSGTVRPWGWCVANIP